jgi:small subunit ribosomal protein S21
MEVEVQQTDSLEDALRRFRKKCQRAGLFSELKRRSHYMKPSEERVLAERKAERREERRLKKQRRRSRFW